MWNILVHRLILRLAGALWSAVSDECVSCRTFVLPFLISFWRLKCKTLELLLVASNQDYVSRGLDTGRKKENWKYCI